MAKRPEAGIDITARNKMQRAFDSARRDLGGLERAANTAKRAFGGLAGALAVRQVAMFAAETGRIAEEIQRQADSLGASAETIQELQFTFRQFNLGADDVADALGTLADRAKDAEDGTKSFIDDFRLLGVEVEDLRGKRPDELLKLVADRVSQIEDPTRRTAGIVRIFGDDLGRRLAPLLIQGAAGFEEFAGKARDANAVMSDDVVQGAAATQQALRELRERGVNFLREGVAELTVSFAELFDLDLGLTKLQRLERELERVDALLARRSRAAGLIPGFRENPELERRQAELQHEIRLLELMTPRTDRPSFQAGTAPAGNPVAAASAAAGDGLQLLDVESGPLEVIETLPDTFEQAMARIRGAAEDTTASMNDSFSYFADQAHSSIQSSLAAAFSGVETDFGDLVRRMVAEFAASGLLRLLGGAIGGPFGAFLAGGGAGLPGFQHGGQFTVPGSGGPDSKLVAFKATPGEEVRISTPRMQLAARTGGVVNNVTNNLRFDVGLESVDQRIAQAAGPISAATISAIRRAMSRPDFA